MSRFVCIAVSLMASGRNGTLYLGVMGNLPRRIYEHREGLLPGFTRKYGVDSLVWYEPHGEMAQRSRGKRKSRSGGGTGSSH